MALKKYAAFNYGHTITTNSMFLNFREPNVSLDEKVAEIKLGSFSLTQFGNEIAKALNSAGTLTYEVTLDRANRTFTISAGDTFELLVLTGSNSAVSAYNLAGFTAADRTGANSYISDSPSGEQYITQTPLTNYTAFIDNREKADAVVKTTPSGNVEAVAYGIIERLKCDFPLITNLTPQRYIRETSTGLEELRAFMDYCIDKKPIEIMVDYTNPSDYDVAILDKTKSNKDGVGYELVEKVRDKLPYYYKLEGLVFRKIEDI